MCIKASSSARSEARSPRAGTLSSNTSSVITIANTPSLNASMRCVVSPPEAPDFEIIAPPACEPCSGAAPRPHCHGSEMRSSIPAVPTDLVTPLT